MEDDLRWKMTDGGRVIRGEVSLQNSFPYWKAYGAGHIPLCGICFYRYNLKFYLPVYLWAVDCSRSNLHPFWELLNIIGDADSCNMFGIETEDGGNKVLF